MSTIAASSYRIASGDNLVNLEKAVNQALAGGWQPYGPPFITHDHRVVQALILPAGVEPAPGAAPIPTGASAISATQASQTQSQQPPAQAAPQPQPAAAPAQAPAQTAQQLFAQPAQAAPATPAAAAAAQPQWGTAPGQA